MKLNETLVTLTLKDKSASMNYRGTCCFNNVTAYNCTLRGGSENATNGFFTNGANPNKANYTVRYLINGAGHVNDYIVRGDVVRICMMAPRGVREDEKISFIITPKAGSQSSVMTSTPMIINDVSMIIYPI
jgi:archaellin